VHRRIVKTSNGADQGESGPSKVFAFDAMGRVVREYTITGQPDGHVRGISGLALDGRGALVALDRRSDTRGYGRRNGERHNPQHYT